MLAEKCGHEDNEVSAQVWKQVKKANVKGLLTTTVEWVLSVELVCKNCQARFLFDDGMERKLLKVVPVEAPAGEVVDARKVEAEEAACG